MSLLKPSYLRLIFIAILGVSTSASSAFASARDTISIERLRCVSLLDQARDGKKADRDPTTSFDYKGIFAALAQTIYDWFPSAARNAPLVISQGALPTVPKLGEHATIATIRLNNTGLLLRRLSESQVNDLIREQKRILIDLLGRADIHATALFSDYQVVRFRVDDPTHLPEVLSDVLQAANFQFEHLLQQRFDTLTTSYLIFDRDRANWFDAGIGNESVNRSTIAAQANLSRKTRVAEVSVFDRIAPDLQKLIPQIEQYRSHVVRLIDRSFNAFAPRLLSASSEFGAPIVLPSIELIDIFRRAETEAEFKNRFVNRFSQTKAASLHKLYLLLSGYARNLRIFRPRLPYDPDEIQTRDFNDNSALVTPELFTQRGATYVFFDIKGVGSNHLYTIAAQLGEAARVVHQPQFSIGTFIDQLNYGESVRRLKDRQHWIQIQARQRLHAGRDDEVRIRKSGDEVTFKFDTTPDELDSLIRQQPDDIRTTTIEVPNATAARFSNSDGLEDFVALIRKLGESTAKELEILLQDKGLTQAFAFSFTIKDDGRSDAQLTVRMIQVSSQKLTMQVKNIIFKQMKKKINGMTIPVWLHEKIVMEFPQ